MSGTTPTPESGPPSEREALETWSRPPTDDEISSGQLPVVDGGTEHEDEDDDDVIAEALPGGWWSRFTTERPFVPPHVWGVVALGLAFLAAEPTLDLKYTAFGPETPVDLGSPAHYAFDTAQDGAFAKVIGFASDKRGYFSHWGRDHELFVLAGTALIVRRPQGPPPPPDTAELFEGQGRLLALDDLRSGFVDRWFRPNARYTNARLQFAALGELPPAKKVWLLVAGDAPRADPLAILWPLLLWCCCAVAVVRGVRAYRWFRARDA